MPEEKPKISEKEDEEMQLPQVVDAHQVLDYKSNIIITQNTEILKELKALNKKL